MFRNARHKKSTVIKRDNYRPHTEYDGKVMFLLCVSVHRAPLVKVWVKVQGPPRSRSRSGAPQVKVGGPPVKVQVKVWGPPWSRSGGPLVKVQVKILGWPHQVKVQVKVRGAPQVKVCPPPPVKVQDKVRVRLLRSRSCFEYF